MLKIGDRVYRFRFGLKTDEYGIKVQNLQIVDIVKTSKDDYYYVACNNDNAGYARSRFRISSYRNGIVLYEFRDSDIGVFGANAPNAIILPNNSLEDALMGYVGKQSAIIYNLNKKIDFRRNLIERFSNATNIVYENFNE